MTPTGRTCNGRIARSVAAAMNARPAQGGEPIHEGQYVAFRDGYAGRVISIDGNLAFIKVPERINGKEFFCEHLENLTALATPAGEPSGDALRTAFNKWEMARYNSGVSDSESSRDFEVFEAGYKAVQAGVDELARLRAEAMHKRAGDIKAIHTRWRECRDNRPIKEIMDDIEHITHSIDCYFRGVPGQHLTQEQITAALSQTALPESVA